ncbi:MAG: hypothetical protein ACPGMQ_06235 [Pirellulales bacterium]
MVVPVLVRRIVYNEGMKKYVVTCLFVLIVSITVGGDALGCPTCKDGLQAADSEGANIARGYFYSILLMIAMPFTLAGSFGFYCWREMRRQQHAEGSNAANIVVPVTGVPRVSDSSPGSSHENHVPSVST